MKNELPVTMHEPEPDTLDDILWYFIVIMGLVGTLCSITAVCFAIGWLVRKLA